MISVLDESYQPYNSKASERLLGAQSSKAYIKHSSNLTIRRIIPTNILKALQRLLKGKHYSVIIRKAI